MSGEVEEMAGGHRSLLVVDGLVNNKAGGRLGTRHGYALRVID